MCNTFFISWLCASYFLSPFVSSFEICNYHPVHDCSEYIARGSDVTCTCRAEVYNPGCGGGVVRHYTISWQELGSIGLHLSNTQVSDEGRVYHCVFYEPHPPDGTLGSFAGQPLTLTTQFVVHVADPRGPTSAQATGPSSVNADGNTAITLTCDAPSSLPAATYSWSRVMGTGKTLTFTPTARDDGAVFICEARNPLTGHSEFDTVTVRLQYPPTTPPVITGFTQGQAVHVGDPLVLACEVSGGKPHVSSVTFTCPGRADSHDVVTAAGLSSHVVFPLLTLADNGTPCICTARWMDSDVYAQQAFVTLTVVEATSERPVGR